jgi:hypothetical protein
MEQKKVEYVQKVLAARAEIEPFDPDDPTYQDEVTDCVCAALGLVGIKCAGVFDKHGSYAWAEGHKLDFSANNSPIIVPMPEPQPGNGLEVIW